MTSNASCLTTSTATSNAITMSLSGVNPALTIAASSNPACVGSSVTFLPTPTNGGTTPTYQWLLNGGAIATGNSYTTSSLSNIDVVTCTMTSNAACLNTSTASSNAITMTINPIVAPTITTSLTTGTNPACSGTNLGFTATSTNGGTSPAYQWMVNGTAAGTNSSMFSSTLLNNNDIVTCTLTSNASCTTTLTATSIGIAISITASPATPTISIGSNGTTLTSSATTGNQWYQNGVLIAGATNQTYTATTNANYTVMVTANGCSSFTSSNALVSAVGITDLQNVGTHFIIYPNPSNGKFTLLFTSTDILKFKIELHNVLGQIVYFEDLKDFNGTFTKDFDLTEYGKGEYFLRITDSKKNQMEKVVIY
jgi:hypothetical protein